MHVHRRSEPRARARGLDRCVALSALWLLGVGTMMAARAEPVRLVTFIEVRGDAVARARTLLHDYAQALRAKASPLEVQLLEELDRPRHFVLLESAERSELLIEAQARGQAMLQALGAALTAPLDRRIHRPFTSSCRSEPPVAAAREVHAGEGAIVVVAHLDIAGGADRAGPEAALERLAEEACGSPGNQGFEVWQQTNRTNHFDLIARWRSRHDLDAFAASSAAHAFRDAVGPWLGSPYDERLYRGE